MCLSSSLSVVGMFQASGIFELHVGFDPEEEGLGEG